MRTSGEYPPVGMHPYRLGKAIGAGLGPCHDYIPYIPREDLPPGDVHRPLGPDDERAAGETFGLRPERRLHQRPRSLDGRRRPQQGQGVRGPAGVVGYTFRKTGYPLAPVILGLVLGPLMEKNLRRSLALSGGDWSVLFSSPLAIALWIIAVIALIAPTLASRRRFGRIAD